MATLVLLTLKRKDIQTNKDELARIKGEKTSDFRTIVANINTILKSYEKGYRRASGGSKVPKFFAANYTTKIKNALVNE